MPNAEIVPYIYERSGPVELPSPWSQYRSEEWRSVPLDGLLPALSERFPHEDLLETTVCVRNGDRLELHPNLIAGHQHVLFVQPRPGQPPTILLPNGCHLDGSPALHASLRDHQTFARSAFCSPVLLTGDAADAAALSACGFRALPTPAPATMTFDWLTTAAALLQRNSADSELEPALTLVGWGVAGLELRPPATFAAAAEHFQRLNEHFRPDPALWSWSIDPRDLGTLEFLLRFGNRDQVRAHLLDGVRDAVEETYELDAPQPDTSVIREYIAARAGTRPTYDERVALVRYIREALVEPLAALPTAADDVVERVRRRVVAEQIGASFMELVLEHGELIAPLRDPAEGPRRRVLGNTTNLAKSLALLDTLAPSKSFARFPKVL